MGSPGSRTKLPLASVARWLAPQGLVSLVRARRQPSLELWEGVYTSYDQVPVHGAAYESDAWLLPRIESSAALKRQLDAGLGPTLPIESRYLLLPALASALLSRRSRLSVLDFGGAVGIGYLKLRATFTQLDACEYYVVDNAPTCEAGERLFAGVPRLHFTSTLDGVPAADIVFMSGVLQYLSDFAGTVRDLARRFSPELFLLTLVPVGDFRTFASAQVNLPGTRMPAWFFNLGELQELFEALGYTLRLRSKAELDFTMQGFPSELRLPCMSNLVFARR
jgi:putative methyltransferase (TIGR04325 family)